MIPKIKRQFLALIPLLLFASASMAETNCGITVRQLQAISEAPEYQDIFGPSMGNLVQGEFSGGETKFIVYQHDDGKGKQTLFISADVPKKNCVSTYAIGFCLNKPDGKISTMKIFAQAYSSIAYGELTLTTDNSGRYKGFILRNGSNFSSYEGAYRKINSASNMNIQSYLDKPECK